MSRFVVKDAFYKKAKKEGYRARSAYKLEEIVRRHGIIRPGDRVRDLGGAPGSWLQVESALVGRKGVVAGLDILPVAPLPLSNVVVINADIRDVNVADLLAEAGITAFDVVTSDIAPNLSGIREVDDARILDLVKAVIRMVDGALRKGGGLLIKLFFNPDLADITAMFRARFSKVVTFKPKASRDASAEVYLVCTGRL
jgi:23S rRNA (uridine2552-2'-O)-methyltransferase